LQSKNNRQFTGRALVAGSGELQLIVTQSGGITASPEFVVFGNVCCGAKVAAELQSTEYLTERVRAAKFEAERTSGILTGKLKIRGDDYDFSLERSPRYDESLTLADLGGTYTRTIRVFLGPTSTYTVTVDASGQLTGSHTNGCVYNGAVSLPDAPRNIVKVNVELRNCPSSITGSGSMNGSYSGLGVMLRNTTAPSDATKRADVLFHSVIGRTWLGPQAVER
jgi:hypothetical protein